MNLLETANNAFLAVIAAPEAIRENREWLREWWRISESRKAGLARIAELESELATLRAKAEPSVPEPTALSPDWALGQLAGVSFPGVGQARDYMKRCIENALAPIAKPEPSIPEPDPEVGDGFEFCNKNEAVEWNIALSSGWCEWSPIESMVGAAPESEYRFRRPIAKPEPQWVACTADEARANPGESQFWLGENSGWMPCGAMFEPSFPYRTTAALSEWVYFDYSAWKKRKDLPRIFNDGGPTWRMRRSEIKVGTVLG